MLYSAAFWTIFLSTPSARRATESAFTRKMHLQISIHALREEGDRRRDAVGLAGHISIHALREEGDSAFIKMGVVPM